MPFSEQAMRRGYERCTDSCTRRITATWVGYAVKVHGKFWEGLPAVVREQLNVAMTESTAYANKIAKEENDSALECVRKRGKTKVCVPTPEERLAFKRALLPVHKKMESRIGGELINSIYRETAFDPGKL